MKKFLAMLLALTFLVSLPACGNSDDKQEEAQQTPQMNTDEISDAENTPSAGEETPAGLALTEEDGLLTCLDVETSPFGEGGLRTVVDATAGSVTFTKTDVNGNDTLEYFKFVPAENSVEKYYYVSAMGTGFYYYYDLSAGEMVRLESDTHEDKTESYKSMGRFDSANETMQSEVKLLTEYFSANFGMTIEDAAGEPAAAGLALTEEDGVLTCLDVETSPFEGGGLRTVVDQAAGSVTFTKTDLNGNDTLEYFEFVPAENSVEKYYYVSAMGTGFYYYYDLSAGEMVRLESDTHEDKTESYKSMGRFDSANETMQSEVKLLTEYFSANFGMTIEDAVKEA